MNKKQNVEERIKQIIVDQLGVHEEKVKLEAKFRDDLGADSLDGLELVMAVEEAFSIQIPDEDDVENKIVTVKDAVDYIEKHLPSNTHIKDLPIGTAFKMDRKNRIVTVQIPYLDLVRAHGLPLDTGSRVILRSHLMILQQNVYEAQRGVTELLDLVDGKKPVQKKKKRRKAK